MVISSQFDSTDIDYLSANWRLAREIKKQGAAVSV